MSGAGDRILRHLLLGALLGGWALALAQDPPGAASSAGPETGSTAQPCVSPGDGTEAEAATGGGGAEAVPCDEQGDAATVDDAGSGPEAIVEEDMAIEATADEVFEPGDEISEDYPIPLPSDI